LQHQTIVGGNCNTVGNTITAYLFLGRFRLDIEAGWGIVIPMSSLNPYQDPEPGKVVSPFAQSENAVPRKNGGNTKVVLWIGLAVVLIAAGAVAGIFLTGYLNDPYRTLEPFPVSKFLDTPRSLMGSKFKAELRVEADLAYKEGVGRLMLFSTKDDSRPIAVMVPTPVAKDIYFTKGQTYMAELEVKEGGLIYANSCKKN